MAYEKELIKQVNQVPFHWYMRAGVLAERTGISIKTISDMRYKRLIRRPDTSAPRVGQENDTLRIKENLITYLNFNHGRLMRDMACELEITVPDLRNWITFHGLESMRPKKEATHFGTQPTHCGSSCSPTKIPAPSGSVEQIKILLVESLVDGQTELTQVCRKALEDLR